MTIDPRKLVANGYNAAAEAYAEWLTAEVVDPARERYLEVFAGLLAPGADVLGLGCGGGGPTTLALAERFMLTGLDISERQVALARSGWARRRSCRRT